MAPNLDAAMRLACQWHKTNPVDELLPEAGYTHNTAFAVSEGRHARVIFFMRDEMQFVTESGPGVIEFDPETEPNNFKARS